MGSDAEVVGGEARPQACDAASSDLCHGAINRSLERHLTCDRIWLHLLNLGLDEIEGQAEERGEETCNGGGADGLHSSGGTSGLQHLLGLGVESQHAEVQGHGTSGSRSSTFEEAGWSIGAGN